MSVRPGQAKGAYTGEVGGGTPTPEVIIAALYEPYDAGTTYAVNAYVSFDGIIYTSRENGNTGNSPDSSPEWLALGTTSANTQGAAMQFIQGLLLPDPW